MNSSSVFRGCVGRVVRQGAKCLILTLVALSWLPISRAGASEPPFVYVVTTNSQFGVMDLATGAFHQIGPDTPEPLVNLIWWKESLLSVSVAGNLSRVNPKTGDVTVIGPTGLGFNVFELAEARGKLYLTDFDNNLYKVDPENGVATLFRATGMPGFPAPSFSSNSDGTINLGDETLYGIDGRLFATFDAFTLDPATLTQTPADCCGPAVYEINPSTGLAKVIAPHTSLNLGAAVLLNERYYAFKWVVTGFTDAGPQIKSQLLILDLETGRTKPLENAAGPIFVDAVAGGVTGAAPARFDDGKSPFPHHPCFHKR
jgi:hypothetical protein